MYYCKMGLKQGPDLEITVWSIQGPEREPKHTINRCNSVTSNKIDESQMNHHQNIIPD